MTLAAAQGLSGVGDVVNVLEFRLNQPERAAEIAEEIQHAAGQGFSATTWMEENRALFRALRLEKLVTAIFIGLITFVAGLNILVVLSMTVTDKARDIAVLRSLGARREQIRTIFLLQGISIGATGTLIGLFTGFLFSLVAGNYHLIPLAPQVYAVPYVPFHPSVFDGVWITSVAMRISIAATILPARCGTPPARGNLAVRMTRRRGWAITIFFGPFGVRFAPIRRSSRRVRPGYVIDPRSHQRAHRKVLKTERL